MPRTALPPTPASSTDIKGQDGSKQLASLQMAFELPPPIIPSAENQAGLSPIETSKTPYLQASETVKSRRRSSAAQNPAKDQFALPPPPTRSRKIIQMKPREDPIPEASTAAKASSSKAATPKNAPDASLAAASSTANTATAAGTKRKQPSATSAAGRKIARKTAHSLIERRRRSKMNEEFAVLKGMIPACTGEMHKLAILQASIEYIRYLEDCVGKLKEQRDDESNLQQFQPTLPTPTGREYNPDPGYSAYADDRSTDVEMAGSEAPSPTFTAQNPAPSISPSPALLAEDSARLRHNSQSSVASTTTDHRHYSYSASSATTSPAFGPQVHYGYAHSTHSASGSTLTSPALPPQRDLDQEATAALLMLNQTDRRGTGGGSAAGRGMNVRDLLTT